MKKILGVLLSAFVAVSALPCLSSSASGDSTQTISYTYSAGEGNTYTREMEALDRGLVAIKNGNSVFLSWRLLDSEDARFGSADKNVSFNVYRGNEKIAEVTDTTNYTDKTAGNSYQVAAVVNGVELDKCEAVSVWSNAYLEIPLTSRPDSETTYAPDGTLVRENAQFFPTDLSPGDLDGDGEYEIVIKWVSSEHDVGSPGTYPDTVSGTVRYTAHKLDGTKMWEHDINLGKNIYSSAHTAQLIVYDFNQDGKAEVISQTSLGSTDAMGNYVSHAAKEDSVVASIGKKIAEYTNSENEEADYRSDGWGLVTTGEEFLTVFNGETGAAIDTIDLPTARGTDGGSDFGDTSGNRSNRFVSNVAYLDGENPYAILLRGYYFGRNGKQRTSIAGISFDGERLSPDYRFDTQSGQPGYYKGAEIYVGQGNHNCTVADVDNDGRDEFITGALCMEVKDDNSFKPRWCTFLEHGDALHIGDYDPTHKGLEFFTVHEDGNGVKDTDSEETKAKKQAGPDGIIGTDDDYGYVQENAAKAGKYVVCNYGMSVIDADTGDILYHLGNTKDTGRGVMANVGSRGFYQISGTTTVSAYGNGVFKAEANGMGSNFRIFWDGDLYDELLDGTNVTSWNGSKMTNIFNAGDYGCVKINGTKSNPGLQADLFGDWREELIYPTSDGNALRVFTTTTPTNYKMKTLMHDPVYRSGVASEQSTYNQPPHIGFYISDELFGEEATEIKITTPAAKTSYAIGEPLDTTGMIVTAKYADGTSKEITSYTMSGYNPETAGKQTVTVNYMNQTTAFDVTVNDITGIEIVSPPKKTVYVSGESIDITGLTVRANYEGGITKEITDYTVSSFDSSKAGKQAITVTYRGKTTTFDVTVKTVSSIEIVSPPKNTNVYIGGSINPAGLVVNAVYDDGTKGAVTDYRLTGFKSNTLGKQTITVNYMGKKDTFEITVLPAAIGALNNTYLTDSSESVLTNVPIGEYTGDFTIEHTVTINSMPSNGDSSKSSTTGFFVRFMHPGTTTHTGGGWYITNTNGKANIYWKSGATRNNAKGVATGIKALTLGETYTFKYEFTNVGTGSGALLAMSIYDSAGKKVSSASGLNVRNFSDTNTGKLASITAIEVYNQAIEGSTASITLDNARVYSTGEIMSVNDKSIAVNVGSASGMKVYAVKYNGAELTDIESFTLSNSGTSTLTASFAPDKVFLWADIMPIDFWSAPQNLSEYSQVRVTVTDGGGNPLSGMTMVLEGWDSKSYITRTNTAATDSDGVAVFNNITKGEYELYCHDTNREQKITVTLERDIEEFNFQIPVE